MSLSKRLFNVARAELNDIFRKLGEEPESLSDEEIQELRRQAEVLAQKDERFPDEVCRYYANLELPIGASEAEVRAAYKRLMKRYHPDRHHGDSEKREVATALVQELRVAYEGLIVHLEGKKR